MGKAVLFIAMSLDGYIADKNGKVDWLSGQEPGKDDMESYKEFIKDISTVVMGWNTYHQIVTELSPDVWFYEDLESYVLTHREMPSTANIKFTGEDVCELTRKLTQTADKDVWICGGACIVRPLVAGNLIDRYYISVIPTILGDGIRLFEEPCSEINLKLIKSKSYNGITDLVYERR